MYRFVVFVRDTALAEFVSEKKVVDRSEAVILDKHDSSRMGTLAALLPVSEQRQIKGRARVPILRSVTFAPRSNADRIQHTTVVHESGAKS